MKRKAASSIDIIIGIHEVYVKYLAALSSGGCGSLEDVWRVRVALSFRRYLPELLCFWKKNEDFQECLSDYNRDEVALKKGFHPLDALDEMQAYADRLGRSGDDGFDCQEGGLGQSLRRLADLVELNRVEVLVLRFALLVHYSEEFENLTAHWGELDNEDLFRNLSLVFGEPAEAIRRALGGSGGIARCGFMSLTANRRCVGRKIQFHNDFEERILGLDGDVMLLVRGLLNKAPPAELRLSDYSYVEPTLGLLRRFLPKVQEQGTRGVNILVHGPPGTGKTQLVRALIEGMQVPLYEVGCVTDDGTPRTGEDRFNTYRLAQAMLRQTNAWILFDEVEDVFRNSVFSSRVPRISKAWVNQILENNVRPAFWVTNEVGDIDPAYLRRFDVILPMEIPPRAARKNILARVCEGISGDTLAKLADCQSVTPAVIQRAARVLSVMGAGSEDPGYERHLLGLVNQTLKAQGHDTVSEELGGVLPLHYDTAFINCEADLPTILSGIGRGGSARMCLYGPPGTGKTAFGRYVAQEVDRPLHIVRASDILGPYVGMTEGNLARVFRKARVDQAVLLIDEVDGFLQSRANASRSWEITAVNEMLTQMETFDGIFIASTNRIDGFDAAALRRFDLKLRFNPLSVVQAWRLFMRHCQEHGFGEPAPELEGGLARLDNLCPGDFAAVSRRHQFYPLQSPRDYLAALADECAGKAPLENRQPIGFLAAR